MLQVSIVRKQQIHVEVSHAVKTGRVLLIRTKHTLVSTSARVVPVATKLQLTS